MADNKSVLSIDSSTDVPRGTGCRLKRQTGLRNASGRTYGNTEPTRTTRRASLYAPYRTAAYVASPATAAAVFIVHT